MPGPVPGTQGGEEACPLGQEPFRQGRAAGEPWFAWAADGAWTGPAAAEVAAGREGRLDYQALLEGLAASGVSAREPGQQEAALAREMEAAESGRPDPDPGPVAALAVEHIPPGPAQAGWLDVAAAAAGCLDENGLAGLAVAARRLTSWAQACELAAVAQITARAAAADSKIGLAHDGRPGRLCHDAVGQVSLALMLSDHGASAWADLAITLSWRLRVTGAALAAGQIDLPRARVIAEATSVLGEQQARAVEAKILPNAGRRTTAQLRAWARRAVIAADPDGAQRRRQEAERRAEVRLYADEDGTATLTGSGLPAVQAAAAMARITAIARAMKAAGQAGGLDLHRARVMLGLLLGTLPLTPPPSGADREPPPFHGGDGGHGDGGHGTGQDIPSEVRDGGGEDEHGEDEHGEDPAGPLPGTAWPELGVIPPALARPAQRNGRPAPGLLDVTLPWTTLAGLADTPGALSRIGPVTAAQARHLAWSAQADPASAWRIIVTNAAGQAIAVARIWRRSRARPAPPSRPPPGSGLAGRVTLTITQDTITAWHPGGKSPPAGGTIPSPGPGRIAAVALRAAALGLARALARAADDEAAGGCAHASQSPGYRPAPRLREHVTARDLTCRNPACQQPAWRADLDHTKPWEDGGRTCGCNLGGACRRHHQLKQHLRWKLEQARPGVFTWTTPAGRSYIVGPDTYPV